MKTKITLTWIVLLALTSILSIAAPLGTAFTYQGRLNAGGAPANGVYDLQFMVHDAEFSGSQIGPTFNTNGVAVSNGLFTVTLNLTGFSLKNQFPISSQAKHVHRRHNL